MEYINKVQLAGKVGRIYRNNVNGKEVARFSVTVEESFKKRTGETVTVPTFIRCEAWQSQSCDTTALEEDCCIEAFGRIYNYKYTDRDGNEKSGTEVKVYSIRLLSYPEPAAPDPADDPADFPGSDDMAF